MNDSTHLLTTTQRKVLNDFSAWLSGFSTYSEQLRSQVRSEMTLLFILRNADEQTHDELASQISEELGDQLDATLYTFETFLSHLTERN
jgi:hypothetical protein